jgi:hypothetical protein
MSAPTSIWYTGKDVSISSISLFRRLGKNFKIKNKKYFTTMKSVASRKSGSI